MIKKLIVKKLNEIPPIKELVELAKSYYDSGEIISEDYLEWQYCNNPAGLPFFSLAYDDKKVVGQYLVIPMNYVLNGKKVLGTLSLNTLTHPEYQGRGLFIELAKATYEICDENDIVFTLGFPNPLSYGGFIKKLDFKEIGTAELLICPLKPIKILKGILNKNKLKHGGDIPFAWENTQLDNKTFRLLEIHDKENYDNFWVNLDLQKFATQKDFEFINWRYLQIPGRKYFPIVVVNGDQISALCVLRVEKVMNINTAIIMDFLIRPNNINDGNQLLKLIIKKLKIQGINMLSSLNPNEYLAQKILRKNLFFKIPEKVLPQKIPVIFKLHTKNDSYTKLTKLSNWSISFGDYDIF